MYRVLVEAPAIEDIERIHAELTAQARNPAVAERWLEELEEAIATLEEFPFRCPLAPEDRYFDTEIRNLLTERYRILFTVVGSTVNVLHLRHSRQDVLKPTD